MIHTSDIGTFLHHEPPIPVIDVRSPAEYTRGHIPGAINMPLFDDEERKIIGTIYKKTGREAAIEQGLVFAGKNLHTFVQKAKIVAPRKTVRIHCWRGGMRSESLAWLLSLAGFNVYVLKGGYKAYRRHIRNLWKEPLQLIVVSGKTGSGKTEILHLLQAKGYQILDLEGIARHRGSAFGALGEQPQPSTEQFENNLADALLRFDTGRPVYIEDESRTIGTVFLPDELFNTIQNSQVFVYDMPKKLRIKRLVIDYAGFPKQQLIDATEKIRKRIGGQHAKSAVEAIQRNDFVTAADIILTYYDKAYEFDLLHHDPSKIMVMQTSTADAQKNASLLLRATDQSQNPGI